MMKSTARLTGLFTICILALMISPLQAAEVSGRVVNAETGRPVFDANVHLVETDEVVSTDKQGAFRFKRLTDGTYTLIGSHVAFKQTEPITVRVVGDTKADIALTPTIWVLNEVVVTGTRTPHLLKDVPVQTEVVSERDFKRTGATTVDEALTSAIGLFVGEDFSGQGATIRGVQQDRVLVMIDGERAVGRVDGSIDLSQYSLENVEKIEVVKGTGSTLYGSAAMGGVINIITRKPKSNTGSARVSFDYGSHASFTPSFTADYGNDDLAMTLGGKLYSTDGFDLDPATPHTNGESAIDRANVNGKFRARLATNWTLSASTRVMHEDLAWIESELRELSVIQDTTYVYDDEETNSRYEGSTTLEYLSGDKYQMKLRFFGTVYNHEWNKFGDSRTAWIDTSKTEDRYFEAAYSSNYVIGANNVATYGLDYIHQDLMSTELSAEKEADRSLSAYLQYDYSPIKGLTFLPGIRFEDHSSFGNSVNPSLNLMYKPSEQIKLRGFVGRGYRAPSIKQQYFVFDHTSAGYVVYGGKVPLPPALAGGSDFEDLKEEHSINSSISAEFSYGSVGMHRLTYFYNHLEGLIDFSLIGFTPTYWRGVYVYQNVETAITQGVEWESVVRLSKAFDIQLSYNYLYSRNLETDQKLTGRPDHTVKFVFSGFYEKLGIGGSFWGNWHSRKIWVARSNTGGNEDIATNDEPEYAPSQARLNVNVYKRFGDRLEVFLRVENLLDDTEVAYGYWPGRQVFAGMNYELSFLNR